MVTKLICVTEKNNNKFYDIEFNGNLITVNYGRVGSKPNTESKSGNLRDLTNLINSKIRKGYVEVTDLKKESSKKGFDFENMSKVEISLFNILLEKSRHFISETFVSDSFTEKQCDAIESLLVKLNASRFDESKGLLLELLRTAPRKIKNVPIFLEDTTNSCDSYKGFLNREIETLSNVKLSLSSNVAQSNGVKSKDFLNVDEFTVVTDNSKLKEIFKICDKYEKFSHTIVEVYEIKSRISEVRYQNHINEFGNFEKLLFHGSRTENWFSILKTCLNVKPSNVETQGAMFGQGSYFADKFRKSMGYTSINSSYWTSGRDKVAYLGLYGVNMVKPLVITDSDKGLNLQKLINKGCRTTHAVSGRGLINDEFIVYESDACTIRYLIEFESK